MYLYHTRKHGSVYRSFVTRRDSNRELIVDWCGEFDTRSKARSAAIRSVKRCREVFNNV